MEKIKILKSCLDTLTVRYDSKFLDSDPLGIVHLYDKAVDREISGFIASFLAYGNAGMIRRSSLKALAPGGKTLGEFTVNLDRRGADKYFKDFKHRWTGCREISGIFLAIGGILREYGSVGAFVSAVDTEADSTIENTLNGIAEKFNDRFAYVSGDKTPGKIVSAPSGGSACKRMCMYFRWMVRGSDGIDFGIWDFIKPSRLIIPVDRHIARMAGLLGLTTRKIADWKMAVEITDNLRNLDPDDPVKYDFALTRPGILGECGKIGKNDCRICILKECCREAK